MLGKIREWFEPARTRLTAIEVSDLLEQGKLGLVKPGMNYYFVASRNAISQRLASDLMAGAKKHFGINLAVVLHNGGPGDVQLFEVQGADATSN